MIPIAHQKLDVKLPAKSFYESFLKQRKISLYTVRAGNVIGGGDWSQNRLIPDIFKAAKKNKKIIIRNPLCNKTLATYFRLYIRIYFTC